jgi:hypothetical protein
MTSNENVKNLVKSNMSRTMGGQSTSMRRIDTYACMPLKNTFNDCAVETSGGKSKLEEKTANRISANVARPRMSGS